MLIVESFWKTGIAHYPEFVKEINNISHSKISREYASKSKIYKFIE